MKEGQARGAGDRFAGDGAGGQSRPLLADPLHLEPPRHALTKPGIGLGFRPTEPMIKVQGPERGATLWPVRPNKQDQGERIGTAREPDSPPHPS